MTDTPQIEPPNDFDVLYDDVFVTRPKATYEAFVLIKTPETVDLIRRAHSAYCNGHTIHEDIDALFALFNAWLMEDRNDTNS